MADALITNQQLNRRLCESAKPIAVREMFVVDSKSVRKLSATETTALKAKLNVGEAVAMDCYEAKVGHADKKNLNERIYPRAVWQDNINRLKPMLAGGGLIGTDGHSSWSDTGAVSPITKKWVDLRMEDDGGVHGTFQVIPTAKGNDLQACLDAQLSAVGFSTEGYGTGHEPGDAERTEYGLGPDEDCTIMDRNYELEKIDSVRSPSVNDARVTAYPSESGIGRTKAERHKSPVHPQQEHQGNHEPRSENMDPIKNLSELATKAPTVHAEHVAAVDAAVAPVKAELSAAVKSLNALIEGVKVVGGVNLPQREVAPAEFVESKRTLEAKVAALESEKAALVTEKASLTAKVAALEGEKAGREKAEAIVTAAKPLIADNSYRDLLKEAIIDKIKSDASFDATKLEAFIDDRCTFFDKIKGATGKGKKEAAMQPAKKIAPANLTGDLGRMFEDETLNSMESTDESSEEVLKPAEELSFGRRRTAEAAK